MPVHQRPGTQRIWAICCKSLTWSWGHCSVGFPYFSQPFGVTSAGKVALNCLEQMTVPDFSSTNQQSPFSLWENWSDREHIMPGNDIMSVANGWLYMYADGQFFRQSVSITGWATYCTTVDGKETCRFYSHCILNVFALKVQPPSLIGRFTNHHSRNHHHLTEITIFEIGGNDFQSSENPPPFFTVQICETCSPQSLNNTLEIQVAISEAAVGNRRVDLGKNGMKTVRINGRFCILLPSSPKVSGTKNGRKWLVGGFSPTHLKTYLIRQLWIMSPIWGENNKYLKQKGCFGGVRLPLLMTCWMIQHWFNHTPGYKASKFSAKKSSLSLMTHWEIWGASTRRYLKDTQNFMVNFA